MKINQNVSKRVKKSQKYQNKKKYINSSNLVFYRGRATAGVTVPDWACGRHILHPGGQLHLALLDTLRPHAALELKGRDHQMLFFLK